MSVWRQKAIECLPKLKKDFEQTSTSIYGVFFELLPAVVEAHKSQDVDQLTRIYNFAEWCFRQNEKDLWNAAGVAFYEHLGDYDETRTVISQWIKPDIYEDIKGLLELRMSKDDIAVIDKCYNERK